MIRIMTLELNNEKIYELKNNREVLMDNNTITYESVEKRLKNKPVSEWTDQDVFDRYVAYGDYKELDEPSVQKLLIEHGYIDELINLVDNVIYDESIIKEILNSEVIQKEKYIVRKGKIDKMIFSENIDLPDDFIDVTLSFIDNNKRTIEIKDLCYIPNKENYIKNIENYKDNIIIISEMNNGIEKKICALKNI